MGGDIPEVPRTAWAPGDPIHGGPCGSLRAMTRAVPPLAVVIALVA